MKTVVSLKSAGICDYQNFTPPQRPGDFEGILRAIFQEVGNLEKLVVDSGPPVSSSILKERK